VIEGKIVGKLNCKFSRIQTQQLIDMAAALTELQADLETHFLVETDTDLRTYFNHNSGHHVSHLIDDPRVQRAIEKHKMTILVGLAHLGRADLSSGTFALDVVYQHFAANPKLSQYALGQLAVLVSGMGLVNVSGRIAFAQALNQYCATIIQLSYGETRYPFKCNVMMKTVMKPTNGTKSIYQFSRYEAKLKELSFDSGVKERHQEIYRNMLEYLSASPSNPLDLDAGGIKWFYTYVKPLLRSTIQLRTRPAAGQRFKSVPARREFFAIETGSLIDPYGIKLHNDSDDETSEEETMRFSYKNNRYLAIALYGGYVNEYILPVYKEAEVPDY